MAAWGRQEFEQKLREREVGYHIHHPFNIRMNEGKLDRDAIRAWVANRYYYQINIPLKDAAILSNCPQREIRRLWIQRIVDHDGSHGDEGGIEAWLRLGLACGLEREEMISLKGVLPGVRFAVDAYVNFARTRPWQEAVCASLTELFAPEIHKERLANWPQHYPWIEASGLQYFRRRLSEARRDVEQALAITLDYFRTREQQERALDILQFKLDVLWTMSDALEHEYRKAERAWPSVAV